jgi:hypothetical protein
MTAPELIGWSCLGGVLPDVLRMIAARHDGPPKYLKDSFFWISLVLLVGVAALAGYLSHPKDVVAALAVGFGAPEIISKLAGKPSDRSVSGKGSLASDLRSWWAI